MLKQHETDTTPRAEIDRRLLGLELYYSMQCVACQARQLQAYLHQLANKDVSPEELRKNYPLGFINTGNGGDE